MQNKTVYLGQCIDKSFGPGLPFFYTTDFTFMFRIKRKIKMLLEVCLVP